MMLIAAAVIIVCILPAAIFGGCIILALLYDYEAAGSVGCVPEGHKGA